MTKKKEKEIVALAEKTVNKFVEEWERDPYLWDTEADIHGELYMRIKKALKGIDKKKIKGRYKEYMSKKERFNRVYCNPLTYVRGRRNYHPDIVIYEDYKFDNDDKRINEPMLWVCEIKYKTNWGCDQHEENRKHDKKKLRQLLKQNTKPQKRGTKYAYFVNLERTKNKPITHYCKRVKEKEV